MSVRCYDHSVAVKFIVMLTLPAMVISIFCLWQPAVVLCRAVRCEHRLLLRNSLRMVVVGSSFYPLVAYQNECGKHLIRVHADFPSADVVG
jgi:hypothetical protein